MEKQLAEKLEGAAENQQDPCMQRVCVCMCGVFVCDTRKEDMSSCWSCQKRNLHASSKNVVLTCGKFRLGTKKTCAPFCEGP